MSITLHPLGPSQTMFTEFWTFLTPPWLTVLLLLGPIDILITLLTFFTYNLLNKSQSKNPGMIHKSILNYILEM